MCSVAGKKAPVLSDLPITNILFQKYKMNAIVNMFSLAGDKLMLEMYLKQLGFTNFAYELFTENKERPWNLKKQVIQDIFIKTNKI